MKNILIIVGLAFFAFLFYLVVMALSNRKFVDIRKSRQCEFTEEILQKEIRGVVIKTFRNKDSHLDETIEYTYLGDTLRDNMLILEHTGVYDSLLSGDQFYKRRGTLDFIVKRDGQERVFQLDYGCNEKVDEVRI